MHIIKLIKIIIFLVATLAITATTQAGFPLNLITALLIFHIARWVFCYKYRKSGYNRKQLNLAVTYIQEVFITDLIRWIKPKAGWYLYKGYGGFNSGVDILGPYPSAHSGEIKAAMYRSFSTAKGSTRMPANFKFLLNAPPNAQEPDDVSYG
jgi:hypothetical protein